MCGGEGRSCAGLSTPPKPRALAHLAKHKLLSAARCLGPRPTFTPPRSSPRAWSALFPRPGPLRILGGGGAPPSDVHAPSVIHAGLVSSLPRPAPLRFLGGGGARPRPIIRPPPPPPPLPPPLPFDPCLALSKSAPSAWISSPPPMPGPDAGPAGGGPRDPAACCGPIIPPLLLPMPRPPPSLPLPNPARPPPPPLPPPPPPLPL